jgi:hypothetical protein
MGAEQMYQMPLQIITIYAAYSNWKCPKSYGSSKMQRNMAQANLKDLFFSFVYLIEF